tara:strand:+ start:246 stop:1307 length:1062 start_codon:yes stop_codon:yes gene_type:complete
MAKKSAPKKAKKTATKMTAKKVKQIVEKELKSETELKFMDSKNFTSIKPRPIRMIQNDNGVWVPESRVSVIAFSNTVNNVGNGVVQTYGTTGDDNNDQNMYELEMTRPFQPNSAVGKKAYHIEGKEVKPVSAVIKWRLVRDISALLKGEYLNHQSSGGSEQELIPPLELTTSLPVICRMIRVYPKLNQTSNTCFPAVDLFLDTFGNAVGVEASNFDDNELLMYKINKRRYTVVEDKFFRIQNGLTVQWNRAVWSDGTNNSRAMVQPLITNTNGNCEKNITTRHQLTSKKGGTIHYEFPTNNPITAQSGQRREYILYHFTYAGSETYLNNSSSINTCPMDLRLSCKNTVKFSDI